MSKNTTQIKAAVVREKGGPFSIETLSLGSPRRDEVLVKVVATGLCHTDMVARDKGYPVPHPIVLGHEGAGIVESVGADVVKIAPGDSVVLTFLTCGRCKPCRLGRMAHCEKTFPLCFGGARLAWHVNMSPRNFARSYKTKTGRTPAKALELFRVEAARRLLEEAKLDVDQIARRCGFGDEERMRATFKRHLAISPRDYRRRFSILSSADR